MSWVYQNKKIENIDQLPSNAIGFIYRTIHQPTNKMYIGKKVLYFNTKKKLTKKEIAEWSKPGRAPKTKIVNKESDWIKYYGSDKWILQQIKEGRKDEFVREILQLCYTKKQLTFYEVYHQMLNNVLTDNQYLNDNILGKFYRRDFL